MSLPFSPATLTCIVCLRDKFSLCVSSHFLVINALRESLEQDIYHENEKLQRMRIRGDRNVKFMDSSRHFNNVGFLGRGGFGEVTLVSQKSRPHKYYAMKKILFPTSRSLKSSCSKLAIEKDAMLRLESEHVICLKASWLETGSLAKPDAAFLLCELMPKGNFYSVISQLHPMVKCYSDFKSYEGRCQAVMDSVSAEDYKSLTVNVSIDEVALIRSDTELMKKFMNIFLYYTESLINMVQFVHENGIVHQDLKPHNILVSADLKLKLGDLGAASAFLPAHYSEQFNWLDESHDVLTQVDKRFPTLDFNEQDVKFAKHRQKITRRAKLPGTRYFCPPESLNIPTAQWATLTGIPQRHFYRHLHYKHDWWSIGCVLYELYTGLHPFLGSFALLDRESNPSNWLSMIVRQEMWCGLLYALNPPRRHPDSFILEPKLLTFIRGLTKVDISERWRGKDVLSDRTYQALKMGYRDNSEPGWVWNEFSHTPVQSKIEVMIDQFQLSGRSSEIRGRTESVSEDSTGGSTVEKFHRIPEVPGFLSMGVSPGTPATPKPSPYSQYSALLKGNQIPKFVLDDEEN